jgi:GNAT superfamily N-acetyltransferase
VRSLIREHGHRKPTWWVGPSATPSDLTERLLGLGFRHGKAPDDGPTATGMAMLETPPGGPAAVEARLAGTFEEFAAAIAVQWEAFGTSEEERGEQREHLEERWERRHDPAAAHAFVALVEGRIVGAAFAVFAEMGALLIGGATLPDARGLGAYRALVRARWDEAERRGTPALVVQAGVMSKPILERLGFRPVCEIQILVDQGL